jgi:serine/threonine protein kinase
MTNSNLSTAIHIPTAFANYSITRMIDTGSTCVVVEAIDNQTGIIYAVKIVELLPCNESYLREAVEKEIRVLGRLNHKFIVKLIEVVRDNNLIFLVMENCDGSNLLDLILSGNLNNISDVKELFKQIVEGVQYLHTQGIAHGDLKPENVGITSTGDVKLLDFGYCKEQRIGFDADKSGTCRYCGPELLTNGIFNTHKADIWSLGILLFVMDTGMFPYKSSNEDIIKKMIQRGELASPEYLDSSIANVYEKMTAMSPNQRPTLDDVLNNLI